jgi:hypothetical protein
MIAPLPPGHTRLLRRSNDMTTTTLETPCDAGVHCMCCHECSCDCHEDDPGGEA